jgi:hypothetical protein
MTTIECGKDGIRSDMTNKVIAHPFSADTNNINNRKKAYKQYES